MLRSLLPSGGWEGMGFCGWWVFRRVSKIAFGSVVWLSFKWFLAVNREIFHIDAEFTANNQYPGPKHVVV